MTPHRIPIRLRDLRIGEEFWAMLTRQRGTVVSTGYVRWDDGTGRKTRIRAVLVRYASGERIHAAEMRVLVEASRRHMRWDRDEDHLRWVDYLPEPGSIGMLEAVARRWEPSETRKRLLGGGA